MIKEVRMKAIKSKITKILKVAWSTVCYILNYPMVKRCEGQQAVIEAEKRCLEE